jgi:DNA-binding XRE family transcriptional regulator
MMRLNTMRARRRVLDLSQGALANRVGCHINTICRLEQGRAVPDLPLAGRIAKALGADVPTVFPELLPATEADSAA